MAGTGLNGASDAADAFAFFLRLEPGHRPRCVL